MGLLSELLNEEKKTTEPTVAPAAEIRSASVVATSAIVATSTAPNTPATPAVPCATCNSHLAWESIYRDGVLRCDQCSPPPSPAMIGGWWGLVEGGSEINSRFTWVPVVFEGAERREALKRDRYGSGPHSSRNASAAPSATFDPTDAAIATLKPTDDSPPRWSAPDAFGWCWGVDGDGTLHMRRRQFVESGVAAMGEGLQWLGEGEAEWLSRMASVDEV